MAYLVHGTLSLDVVTREKLIMAWAPVHKKIDRLGAPHQ